MTGSGYATAASTGLRGAGLGNEVIAWAKSFLVAREFGATHLAPLWGLNRYKLGKQFGIGNSSIVAAHALSAVLPRTVITREMYLSTGRWDYAEAVRSLAERGRLGLGRVIVSEGMWGGYAAIAPARPFLWSRVLGAPSVQDALSRLPIDTRVRVGLHVRLGDFADVAPGPGQFNRAVPTAWYAGVIREIAAILGDQCAFIVCSDAPEARLSEILEHPQTQLFRGRGISAAVQDLAVLASTDLIVCSVSSFSMLAAFLSSAPYVWFRPQLHHEGSLYTLWGHEEDQAVPESLTASNARRYVSGMSSRALAWEEGIPFNEDLLQSIATTASLRNRVSDLLYYGVAGEEK